MIQREFIKCDVFTLLNTTGMINTSKVSRDLTQYPTAPRFIVGAQLTAAAVMMQH